MRSPLQLARIAIGGSLLVVFAYPAILLRAALEGQDTARLILALMPIVVALAISFIAASKLAKGLRTQRWPDSEIESARDFIRSRWISRLVLACVLAYGVAGFWNLLERSRHASVATLLLLPIMTISRVGTILPLPSKPGERIDWSEVKPIHSDHWGQPPLHS